MKKIIFTILLLLACVSSVELGKRLIGPRGVFRYEARDAARSKGDTTAGLWISEYLDFQCEDCRKAHEVIKAYLTNYPSEIYYQVRFLPLSVHVHAWVTALGAECAARQKAYWEYEALLFEKQPEWTESQDARPFLLDYAAQVGLDVKKWQACTEDPSTEKTLSEEKDKANLLGLKSTPTFFINNKEIIGSKALKEELEKFFRDKK